MPLFEELMARPTTTSFTYQGIVFYDIQQGSDMEYAIVCVMKGVLHPRWAFFQGYGVSIKSKEAAADKIIHNWREWAALSDRHEATE